MTSATIEKQAEHAQSLIARYAMVCGILGMVPGSSPILAAIDVRMVLDLRANYSVRLHIIDSLGTVVLATFAGYLISDFLLSFVGFVTSGVGFLIKGGVAFGVTRIAGRYASNIFKDRKLRFS
jgi:uncharacterized protein (DUF697 family)